MSVNQKPRRTTSISIDIGEKLDEIKKEMGASTLNAVMRNLIYLYDRHKVEGIPLPKWGDIDHIPPKPKPPRGEPFYGYYDEEIEKRNLPIKVKRMKKSKTLFVCIICGQEWVASPDTMSCSNPHSGQPLSSSSSSSSNQ